MIYYYELPETISEYELEQDIKENLLNFFDDYALDDKPWPEDERLEQAVWIIEEHLGHAVRKRSRLVQRVSKELGDRMETARAMYRYHVAKLKEEI